MKRPGYLRGFSGMSPQRTRHVLDDYRDQDMKTARQREKRLSQMQGQVDKLNQKIAKHEAKGQRGPNFQKFNSDKEVLIAAIAQLQAQISCLREAWTSAPPNKSSDPSNKSSDPSNK